MLSELTLEAQQNLLIDIADVTQRPLDTESFSTLCRLIAKLFQIDKVGLYERQTQTLEGRVPLQFKGQWPEQESAVSMPFPTQVLADLADKTTGAYLFCHLNTCDLDAQRWLTHWDVEALHCIPLLRHGEQVGVLVCGEQGNVQAWGAKRTAIVKMVAGLVVNWMSTHLDQQLPSPAIEREVFTLAKEGIIVTDASGYILDVNPAFCRITGYSLDECFGKTPSILKSGRYGDEFYEAMWHSLRQTGQWQGEIWNKRKNGELYPEWLSITVLNDQDNAPFRMIGVLSDITMLKRVQLENERWVMFDGPTGLPNKQMLLEHLRRHVALCERRSKTLGLLTLAVRPSAAGRTYEAPVIAHIVGLLLQRIRQNDLLARIGHDEFALVVDEYEHSDQLARVANKLISALIESLSSYTETPEVKVGIGVARFGEDATEAETLILAADQARFVAESASHSTFAFSDPELHARWQRLGPLTAALEQSLVSNQLKMYYQPVLDMKTGKVVEIEALVRWPHAEYGLMTASDFMSIAKAAGLSGQLFNWALGSASNCFSRIRASGFGTVPISLNITGHELLENDCFNHILQFLADGNIGPGMINIEIPEGYLLPHWDELHKILEQLRAAGIGIVMDAYGAEYASLYALATLEIDGMKIDRSMISTCVGHDVGQGGMAALLAASACLSFKTTAVGVESGEASEWLRQSGCYYQQGDYIAPAMDELSILEWMQSKAK